MKFLFDLFPVILFFAVFKWSESHVQAAQAFVTEYLTVLVADGMIAVTQVPILLATAVVIIATIFQILYLLLRRKKIEPMLWVSLLIVIFFGGATIYFHNETFIKWKPTVLYWCFSAAFIISQLFLKKNLIRVTLEKQITLPDNIWSRLNIAWAIFFLCLGIINLYVAFNFSTAAWVNFKLFGSMGLTIVFVIGQTVFLSRYVQERA